MRRHQAITSPWLRRTAALGAALLVGVLVGGALRGEVTHMPDDGTPAQVAREPSVESGDDRRQPVGAAEPGPRPAEPTSSVRGVGTGFDRSEAGAVAAAVSYATASQSWVYLSDDDVVAAAEAVIVPASHDDLVHGVVDDVRALREGLAAAEGAVWYVVSPLATTVESYTEGHAVVRVWVVRVLSAEGAAVPQAGWETVSLELAWDEDDWRVVAVADEEGPTPQLEAGARPWSAQDLADTLHGFVRAGVR